MKYWYKGFYDEFVADSVEITEEYYLELLEGQSKGKEIHENDEGIPILVEHQYTFDEIRSAKILEIKAYDGSGDVNSFTLSGKQMWLDKDTRVGLVNSISIEQAAGKETTVLWYDAVKYVIPIPLALQMLSSLELYALASYNATQEHIAAVRLLTSKEEVEAYDYTSGYPEKLVFNLNQ